MPVTYKGANTQLLLQRASSYRALPAPANAFDMKFNEITLGDDDGHVEDPTINTNSVLMDKRDTGEQSPNASISSILCLNNIGQWLTLLWGTPSTSGSGTYTHTWTLDNAERPSALLELGFKDATEYRRWVGFILDSLSWDVMSKDQNIAMQGTPAVKLANPGSAFDSSPTVYAKNRACVGGGEIYDIDGSSTLGRVSEGSVSIANNHEFFHLADDQFGYGSAVMGDPTLTGSLSYLWGDDTSLQDYQEDHTTIAMSLISRNAAGNNSLKLILPNVEFDKPSFSVPTRKGLVQKADWRAHAGATAPTIELVNGIASY